MKFCIDKYWSAGLISLGLLITGSSVALERTRLNVDQLQGDGWQAQQLQITLQLDTQPLRAQVKAASARLAGLAEPIRELLIDCLEVQLLADRFACPQARISGVFPYVGQQQWLGAATYTRTNGAIKLSLRELKLANGTAQLQTQLQGADWQTQLGLQNVDLNKLLQLAQRLAKDFKLAVPLNDHLDIKGTADLKLQAQGQDTQPQQIEWQAQAHGLTFNNAAGTLATDTLAINTSGQAHTAQSGWHFTTHLNANSGQAYAEPIFIDLSNHALSLDAQAQWDGQNHLQLQQLALEQQGIITATAQGTLQLDATNPVPLLQLQIDALKFPGSFATYLQPFLLDSSFKNLNTSGSLQGNVAIQNTATTSIDLQLQALHADDGGNNLRLDQVNGEIHWRNTLAENAEPPRSMLSWQSGSLLGLELGATQLQLELWDTNARVAEPTRIPIFNGALAIDAFRVRKAGTPQMAFMLDANIEPINVAQLSKAFGWPEFGGELSGKITKLRLEEGVLTLGATLTAQVFNGDVSISDMRLEGALTQWPRFNANIAMNNLDLEQVTQAFSFGRITGRLSGEINQLALFNWQPESFDVHLYTPANDRSKHRISQRAVQNIGSIGGSGGGVAAALQSGFLKFFDDFNYDKLGVSCRLINDVCLMNGIAPAQGDGYYLVKGKGLPRIDVIGNAARVDWPRLLAQFKAATESQGPVVK